MFSRPIASEASNALRTQSASIENMRLEPTGVHFPAYIWLGMDASVDL